jgi:uncharacterized membrane protein YkvA (DUF1232 family)
MAFVALWRQLRAAHHGGPTVRARLRALPRMTVASLRRRRRYDGLWRLALMGTAFLYVLWPLDLMPVFLLGPVGLIDDAVVVTWLAGAVLSETGRFLEWERRWAVSAADEDAGGGRDAGTLPGGVGNG